MPDRNWTHDRCQFRSGIIIIGQVTHKLIQESNKPFENKTKIPVWDKGVRICSLYQTHITLNCPVPDRDNLNTTNRSSFTILNKFTVSNIHKHINRDCFLPCRGILEEKIYIWHLLNFVTISSGKIVWNHIIITFDKMCHAIYFVLACHIGTIWG